MEDIPAERRQVTIGLYKVLRRKGKVHPKAEGNRHLMNQFLIR
jgi:hypothetical protein